MTPEEKQQIEAFVRAGAATMIQGKPLEDVLNYATTGLHLIEKLRAVEAPKPPAKPTRKKS